MKPNLISGMTAYGEFMKPRLAGRRHEELRSPGTTPLLHVPGSSKPEWLPRQLGSSSRLAIEESR